MSLVPELVPGAGLGPELDSGLGSGLEPGLGEDVHPVVVLVTINIKIKVSNFIANSPKNQPKAPSPLDTRTLRLGTTRPMTRYKHGEATPRFVLRDMAYKSATGILGRTATHYTTITYPAPSPH